MEIVVDSGEEEGVYNPRVLERIESIEQAAVTLQKNGMQAANTASIVDVVKEINCALNENAREHYRIPDSRAMVAQEFLLFRMSGSEDLERLVDDENRKARISLLVPEEDMSEFSGYLHALSDRVHNAAQGEVTVEITGIKTIEMETFDSLMTTVSTSYLIAFLVITPLMILVVGQFLQGIVFMLPNVLPIIVALGLMHVFGFPLDLLAIMIGSIAIGIAVDDTIHFNETYRSLRREGSDCQAALAQTVVSSGSAMLTTTAVLCAGFMVYCFASMEAVRHFGIITAICVGLAFLADITLAPAIVTLFDEQDET